MICLRQLFFTLNRRRAATTKYIVNFQCGIQLAVFHAICYIFPHSQYCQRLSVSLKGCYSIVTSPGLRLSAFLLHTSVRNRRHSLLSTQGVYSGHSEVRSILHSVTYRITLFHASLQILRFTRPTSS